MKKFLFTILGVSVLALLPIGWHLLTGGFRVDKVYDCGDELFEGNSPIPDDIAKMLKKPFTYMGRGSQIYAFESEDKQVVLKIAKLSHYHLPFSFQIFHNGPFFTNYCSREQEKRKNMQEFDLQSYSFSQQKLKPETELLFLHDKKGKTPFYVTIKNFFKKEIVIDLNQTFFMVQKRATSFDHKLIKAKDPKEIASLLTKYFELIHRTAKKHFLHKDCKHFIRNLGVVDERVIFIDLGSFEYQENLDPKSTLQLAKTFLQTWAKKHHPSLLTHLEKL